MSSSPFSLGLRVRKDWAHHHSNVYQAGLAQAFAKAFADRFTELRRCHYCNPTERSVRSILNCILSSSSLHIHIHHPSSPRPTHSSFYYSYSISPTCPFWDRFLTQLEIRLLSVSIGLLNMKVSSAISVSFA